MTQTDKQNLKSDLKVGFVVLLAFGLFVAGIILAGGDKGLFLKKKAIIQARLSDVGGLKKGASVTMAGMVIGRVSDISFDENVEGYPIEVTMEIREDVRPHIKVNAVPTIRTQGMMGDRYVDIGAQTESAETLPGHQVLTGQAASDFDETLRETMEVLVEAEKLLASINEQKGTMGDLFYDQKLYDNLVTMTDELTSLIQDFKEKPKKYVKLSIF
ncbi:MAG: hypothetical protein COV74_00375 [Candidatus Omnitrophica bacterium CG11_big_fil_rev_8_21_14_0_20_45_26]|uniref:Mce/MlaD domain-containing protein n=1 Tax=Candidatus Abzuiibacterium crystallinum TaxID=1974748 RepID=A0A2H0LT22_9BACT|nr:MAG: hypothetical protein COV74_00375 [Candidatus Omnitrophica bacterium CG11_big_fil_rev_8_21_14_0_20_45_26]PIW64606.1 MAG: hypothetical protein COW12_05405 [Candidatus Omnitrophica bacterium CG12_big_fil_rev_8_21_14_0_65_45_16]